MEAGYNTDIINEDYIKKLYDSAPLHDIGKIRISDLILNKLGRLTPEEFDIMKTHIRGKKILQFSLSGGLSMAIDMASYQH